MEETGGPGENHRPVASHWQTLSHNVVHLALIEIRSHHTITATYIYIWWQVFDEFLISWFYSIHKYTKIEIQRITMNSQYLICERNYSDMFFQILLTCLYYINWFIDYCLNVQRAVFQPYSERGQQYKKPIWNWPSQRLLTSTGKIWRNG